MIPTRRFGRTELAMPILTCGGMRYQHAWSDEDESQIPAANQANLEATIERAFGHGITHIETARGYGTSELQLGKILPRLPRHKLIVQTKISPEGTGADFLKTFDLSLKNLQLDHVELLSLHGINNHELLDQSLIPGGPLEAARMLQRDGRVKHIGFSTHAACDVIKRACATGEFDYVNLHWYWVNQSNDAAVAEAVQQDMGVFIISPNDKGGKLYEPPEKLSRLCAPLSPMAFNNLFCLQHPAIHTLSIGAARPSDFDAHVQSLQFLPQAAEYSSQILGRLHTEMESALGAEWLARWPEGVPSWEQCPAHVNVWEIVRLWNFAKALDMVEFGKMRYNLLGQAGHWFPGKNAGKFSDPEMRAALANSPFAEQILSILHEAHALFFDKPIERLSKS